MGWRRPQGWDGRARQESTKGTPQLVRVPIDGGSERFVEHLNRTGRVTTTEAIELLGVSRPTAIRHLQHLVDAGLLEVMRKSPNDPRGYWRTVAEGS